MKSPGHSEIASCGSWAASSAQRTQDFELPQQAANALGGGSCLIVANHMRWNSPRRSTCVASRCVWKASRQPRSQGAPSAKQKERDTCPPSSTPQRSARFPPASRCFPSPRRHQPSSRPQPRMSLRSRPKCPSCVWVTLPMGFIAPCLPTNAPHPPSGDQWLHEVKHDGFRGYRSQGRRAGETLRAALSLMCRCSDLGFLCRSAAGSAPPAPLHCPAVTHNRPPVSPEWWG
jgi:hypothetical protein